jgi:hypothetical protein
MNNKSIDQAVLKQVVQLLKDNGIAHIHDTLYEASKWADVHYVSTSRLVHNEFIASAKVNSTPCKRYTCKALRSTISTLKIRTYWFDDGATRSWSIDKVDKALPCADAINVVKAYFQPHSVANGITDVAGIWVFFKDSTGKTIQHSYTMSLDDIMGAEFGYNGHNFDYLAEQLDNTPMIITDRDLRILWQHHSDNMDVEKGDNYAHVNERLINLNTKRAITCEKSDALATMVREMRITARKTKQKGI